jgi:hypothetical protein
VDDTMTPEAALVTDRPAFTVTAVSAATAVTQTALNPPAFKSSLFTLTTVSATGRGTQIAVGERLNPGPTGTGTPPTVASFAIAALLANPASAVATKSARRTDLATIRGLIRVKRFDFKVSTGKQMIVLIRPDCLDFSPCEPKRIQTPSTSVIMSNLLLPLVLIWRVATFINT